MTVRDTSIEAYIEENKCGKAAEDRATILRKIHSYPGVTRKELSECLDIPINVVTPRVNELLATNTLREDGIKRDPISNRSSHCLYLNLPEDARMKRGRTDYLMESSHAN